MRESCLRVYTPYPERKAYLPYWIFIPLTIINSAKNLIEEFLKEEGIDFDIEPSGKRLLLFREGGVAMQNPRRNIQKKGKVAIYPDEEWAIRIHSFTEEDLEKFVSQFELPFENS